jgi:hypothetical protein
VPSITVPAPISVPMVFCVGVVLLPNMPPPTS